MKVVKETTAKMATQYPISRLLYPFTKHRLYKATQSKDSVLVL